MTGSARRRLIRKASSARRVGLRRQAVPRPRRDLDDLVPPLGRTHDAAQRGDPLAREKPRRHAVGRDHEVLDELAGAVLRLHRQVRHGVAVEDRAGLDRLEIEGSLLVPAAAKRLRDGVLGAELLDDAGRSSPPSPASPRPRGPRRRCRRRAWPGCGRPPDRARTGRAQPSGSKSISATTASRSSPSFSEVRSVESFSGSIGKISRRRVDRGRVRARVADRWPCPSSRGRRRRPPPRKSASGRQGAPRRRVSWSRSRESSLSIDDPQPVAHVANPAADGRRAADRLELGEDVPREAGLEATVRHRAPRDRLQVRAVVAAAAPLAPIESAAPVAIHAGESKRGPRLLREL